MFRRMKWRMLWACLVPVFAFAQRAPVLQQVDLPHSYYWREMYVPQLTTGPSSVAWMPDSSRMVYSMGGSLWMQDLKSDTAQQLTAGPGYDYQPDCSADGNWVVFDRHQNDAIELWALDLRNQNLLQLTREGAVNLEPRFSPDGLRIAFVSTSNQGHFHIFAGDFSGGGLTNVQQLTKEHISDLPRYYYSQADHEISPAWSPDGREIVFVSNRGHIYGTGGFWRMKAEPGAEAREIHYEETAWKARPEFSPDGKRLVYASYLGRQWHQLWVMPANGGDAFPLSYGSFDAINPRWSRDGAKIAFISNRGGNTALWIQTMPTGSQAEIVIRQRKYIRPTGRLRLKIVDSGGKRLAARVFVTGSDGRAYAPDDAWIYADDSFDRSQHPYEAHYFQTSGTSETAVPVGHVTVEVMRGLEFRFEQRQVEISAGKTSELIVKLQPLNLPRDAAMQWISGDVHVHMNYGGAYRNTPQHLVEQAEAENLPIIEDLVVNKEQRIPDIAYFSPEPDHASNPRHLLLHGQEFHTSYWGHLGLLNLTHNFLIPGYVGYTNTAAASLYPANANVADFAHAQGALVGYVHPFDTLPDPAKDLSLTDELPADVALGKVDYIEVVGFSDHKTTADIWYRLLNCGFRLPAAGGTDAMANYASLRGPVGLNRVYVNVPRGPLHIAPWLQGLKAGKTFATNGPLLGFTLNGASAGGEVKLPVGSTEVKFSAWLRSIVPVDHFQVVCNGKVTRDLPLGKDRTISDITGTLPLAESGWCLLRAYSDTAEYPVLDIYPYATTSPVYVSVAGSKQHAHDDAAFFVIWIDRLISSAQANHDWNTAAEKEEVLDLLQRARDVYRKLE